MNWRIVKVNTMNTPEYIIQKHIRIKIWFFPETWEWVTHQEKHWDSEAAYDRKFYSVGEAEQYLDKLMHLGKTEVVKEITYYNKP